MVDVEPGQIYAADDGDGNRTEHVLVIDVTDGPWTTARAMIYSFENGETYDVHARTLWRMCERLV